MDQELLIYEAFPHDSQLSQGNLKVRFKKVPGTEGHWVRRAGPGICGTHAHGDCPQVPHNINFREKKAKPSKKKAEGVSPEEGAGARGRVARFRYFEDIYGYSGVGGHLLCSGVSLSGTALTAPALQVFICGPSPHWLLVTARGALRLHPMGIDGPIDSFAPFHNVNCPRGFLYFNRQVVGPPSEGPRRWVLGGGALWP